MATLLPTVLQVKEKFGTLRLYVKDASDDVRAMIELAVERSAVTCEECEAAGRLRHGTGGMRTLCDDHDAQPWPRG